MKINEGGPGSGVAYRNTSEIDKPMSEFVSVGTRKGMQDNMDFDEYDVPIDQITKVAQKSFVPSKVNHFMQNRDSILKKPIDLLWVRGDGYHMIDGHHRYLAAEKLNMKTLPAKVYRKSEKTMDDGDPTRMGGDETESRFDTDDDPIRTTKTAWNPGLYQSLEKAADALVEGDWDSVVKSLTEAKPKWEPPSEVSKKEYETAEKKGKRAEMYTTGGLRGGWLYKKYFYFNAKYGKVYKAMATDRTKVLEASSFGLDIEDDEITKLFFGESTILGKLEGMKQILEDSSFGLDIEDDEVIKMFFGESRGVSKQ